MTKAKRTLRDVSREPASYEEWSAILDEAGDTASDRMCALLLGILIQDGLTKRIIAHLPSRDDKEPIKRLFDREGALSTFFGQIGLAFAMGLIDDKQCGDLDIVRKVRNAFAHTGKPITFATPEIARECRKLKTGQKSELSPKSAFKVCCFELAHELASASARQHRLAARRHYRQLLKLRKEKV